MHCDPAHLDGGVQETAAPPDLLGPGLLVPGYIKSRAPMFAGASGNAQLDAQQDAHLLLLPFVNQGAVRGDYQVFMNYQRK